MGVTWLVEDLGGGTADWLLDAARDAGCPAHRWDDAWWDEPGLAARFADPVVFQGSLGNAARIAAHGGWQPGAFCDAAALRFSAWAPGLATALVSRRWVCTTVRELASDPGRIAALLDEPSDLFVRPDSPLKPFSGRVLAVDEISLDALDYDFYYDDLDLPVVAAPAVPVGAEWRFVVVAGRVVAASGYVADGRRPFAEPVPAAVGHLAHMVAAQTAAVAPVYVLDLAEVGGEVRVVELNPFSGADLYHCDRAAVVDAVNAVVQALR